MQRTSLILLERPIEEVNESVGITKRRSWESIPVAFQINKSETRLFLLKPEGKRNLIVITKWLHYGLERK